MDRRSCRMCKHKRHNTSGCNRLKCSCSWTGSSHDMRVRRAMAGNAPDRPKKWRRLTDKELDNRMTPVKVLD